jgi:hypothetical protein
MRFDDYSPLGAVSLRSRPFQVIAATISRGFSIRSGRSSRGSWAFAVLASCAAACVSCGASESDGKGPSPGQEMGGGSSVVMGIDLPGSPQYYRFVRLTNAQWAQSVQDIFQLPIASGLEANFESPVAGSTDFTNNELLLDVNQRSWADFQTAAETLAEQVTSSETQLASIYSGTDAEGFIKTLGRRAYRRPLTTAEVKSYSTLFSTGSTMSGSKSAFAKGAALVIRAMLQSPFFLYRSELSAAGAPLSGYEIAAKLSLWLRGTTPSDELLDLAPSLTTSAAAVALADTMMSEPSALAVMRQFHGQLLHFDRFKTISKMGVASYDESLNDEFEQSSYLFFDRIFSQGQGVNEILTSTTAFMGAGMAKLYGVEPAGNGFSEQDLGAQRVGYFSQLPYLTLNALNDEPDPIHRGVSINLDVLCAPLGPPAAVIPAIPPLESGQTNRQRISTLTAPCGGACHGKMINPIGFAFEHFDGMGQYRDNENGDLPIDSSGSFDFSDGSKSYEDAAGLMQAMAESEQVHLCYAKKLASFALQRDIIPTDLALIQKLASASRAANGSVKQVIGELVENDAFRKHAGAAR